MNLLFVMYIYPSFGGVETVTSNLANYLSSEHTIYTLSLYSMESASKAEGVSDCFYFPGEDTKANIQYYNDLAHKLKIDCVINQGMFECLNDIVFSEERDKKVKVYSCLHGMPGYEKKHYWLYDEDAIHHKFKHLKHKALSSIDMYAPYRRYLLTYKNTYRKCTIEGEKVILLADGYIDDFIRTYDLEQYREKICAIANPLSPSYSQVEAPKWEEKENMVLYVGRLSKEKRVHMLINVWKRTSHKGWKLVIIGDGPEREVLEKQADEASDIIFIGFEKNPEKYYQKAKILLLTSTFEGFGMCLVEGMRYGVYPVSFNVSKGVESVLANGGGLLIPKGNIKKMIKELQMLISNTNELKSLSLGSYEKSKHFLIERIGETWNSILNK